MSGIEPKRPPNLELCARKNCPSSSLFPLFWAFEIELLEIENKVQGQYRQHIAAKERMLEVIVACSKQQRKNLAIRHNGLRLSLDCISSVDQSVSYF